MITHYTFVLKRWIAVRIDISSDLIRRIADQKQKFLRTGFSYVKSSINARLILQLSYIWNEFFKSCDNSNHAQIRFEIDNFSTKLFRFYSTNYIIIWLRLSCLNIQRTLFVYSCISKSFQVWYIQKLI